MIENYLHKLSNLRTDRGRNRYPAYTLHRAAHKPFLLLSIMDLIAQGTIAENFIEPSFELVETFNGYWNSIMPLGSETSAAMGGPLIISVRTPSPKRDTVVGTCGYGRCRAHKQ